MPNNQLLPALKVLKCCCVSDHASVILFLCKQVVDPGGYSASHTKLEPAIHFALKRKRVS